MKAFVTLMRREFWENRGAFLTTPLVVGGLLIFFALLTISGAAVLVEKVNGQEFMIAQAVEQLKTVDPSRLELVWDANLFGLSALFNGVLFFVVFFYLLGALYDDRKDRSILFWKSLPISDTQTVMSKLTAAAIMAPLLTLGAMAATQIVLLLIATVLLWHADIGVWDYLWGPADPLYVWSLLLAGYVVHALWMAPIWGWLLLTSAFARGKAFLWAVVPPIMVGLFMSWFRITQYLRFDDHWWWKLLGERLFGGVLPIAMSVGDDQAQVGIVGFSQLERVDDGSLPISFAALVRRFSDADLWWGLAIGAVFITGAIFIRRYRDDT
ncbi:MAG: hypothetical protein R3200_12035 [Xanthomonadales bacterium]|nr:hypothetical protein [Xanthomonadales bacterium]